jgi:hypothetical protein
MLAESNKEQFLAALAKVECIKQQYREVLKMTENKVGIMSHPSIQAAIEKATNDAI